MKSFLYYCKSSILQRNMPWMMLVVLIATVNDINASYASECFTTTEQQRGLCMPIKSCKRIYEFFLQVSKSGRAISEEDKKKLEPLFCGKFQNVPHICCPETEIQLNVDGLNILKNTACGIYNADRIANGRMASIFQFPWMALLKYEGDGNPFKCGGTLISDQYVLSAAHCIKGKEHLIKKVRLGEYQISAFNDCTNVTRKNQCAPPVEDIEVDEFILHEAYKEIYNDIALIRLRQKVQFKRHIKPVCLPIYDNLRPKEHDNYVISGWGKTENDTNSDILLMAFLSKVNRTICENQLREYNLRNPLNYGHICAGGRNLIDSCRGDSGGPLGFRDSYNERLRFVQFGIVSLGLHKCGVVNVPGVYTNVSHYIQWITDHLVERPESEKVHFITPRFVREKSCTTPALENGFCVPYKDCPFVNELVQNYGSTEAIPQYNIKYILKSKCSQDNEPIKLCCKMPNNYVPSMTSETKPPVPDQSDSLLTADLDYNKDFISQFNPDGLSNLMKLSCGTSGGDRIAGGNETDLAEFPWMALLRHDATVDDFKCGGSLISNRYVLTATHCVRNAVYPIIGVRLGEHNIATNPDCKQKFTKTVCNPVVEDFGIEKIITHPRYNKRRRINDIALIKLDRDVEFKKHIKPVCLPITSQSFETISNGFTIAGWGTTENKSASSVLLKATVRGESRSVCQNFFASQRLDINQKHICAADLTTGRDSCKGDSGGPLISFNTYTSVKRFIQYGIVAAGGTACNLDQKLPGIYTNVLTFLPWITSNIVE